MSASRFPYQGIVEQGLLGNMRRLTGLVGMQISLIDNQSQLMRIDGDEVCPRFDVQPRRADTGSMGGVPFPAATGRILASGPFPESFACAWSSIFCSSKSRAKQTLRIGQLAPHKLNVFSGTCTMSNGLSWNGLASPSRRADLRLSR